MCLSRKRKSYSRATSVRFIAFVKEASGKSGYANVLRMGKAAIFLKGRNEYGMDNCFTCFYYTAAYFDWDDIGADR